MFGTPQIIAETNPGTCPPTYFLLALLCLLILPITGVVAVINSLLVTYRFQRGDIDGAARSSYLARLFCFLTPIVLLVGLVAWVLTGASS
jgi:hypothetical protein